MFVAELIQSMGIKLLGVYDRCEGIQVCNGVKTQNIDGIMEKYNGQKIIITTAYSHHDVEMVNKLRSMGVSDDCIVKVNFNDLCHGMGQYFDESIISFNNEDCLVDCGGYDLGTTIEFAQRCKRLKKSWVFEPSPENIKLCEEATSRCTADDVVLIQSGVWSQSGELKFEQDGAASCVSDKGTSVVSLKTIDEVIGTEKVTFIKMDVEGAELEGLKGAKGTIARNRPTLAICLYHKMEDLIEIPKYILDLRLGYQLYIRKYCWSTLETVLYAVPK